jgi:acyl phosphate:glycerol-3-phosphate acyltransferase
MTLNLSALFGAYLLGAVPFGYIIVRLLVGADVRAAGSGSTGATNVTRAAGIKAGLLTYFFDVAKGITAVLLMKAVTPDVFWHGAAASAAIVGHMFPVFLKFKGGKGVATGVGAYLLISPLAVLSTLAVWIAIFLKTRIVSLGSVVATALVPVWILFWSTVVFRQPAPLDVVAAVSVGCVLVILKHHENIRRLIAGTESRFSRSSKAAPPAEGEPS